MTADTPEAPALLPVIAEQIPAELREQPRWACWRAEWNPKRGPVGKWDKIPCHPRGYRVSTKRPEAWVSFGAAVEAYRTGRFAGIGYLMTGEQGLVGVDLDSCVESGRVAPWAQGVLDSLGGYAEVSPSGRGLRAFTHGTVEWDWNNHEQGIEVYAGHTPRFLTVTGQQLGHGTIGVAPAGVLEQLGQRYAREREAATVISLAMPELVDELALPDVAALDLPPRTRDLLADGTTGADRSRSLFAAAVDLFRAGLTDAEVLSVLAENPHAMGIALDHRRQDHERALMYLWVEHTQKGKARAAASRVATADDFEDVAPEAAPAPAPAGPVAARPRFAPVSIIDLMARVRARWLVKHLLPEMGVGIVFGPSMAGKSFMLLDLCLAIVRGVQWRGKRVNTGSVAYILAEGASGFPDRLRAYSEFHGVDLGGLPLHVIPAAPNLLEKGDVKELVGVLKGLASLRLIVVDTIAQTTPGADENSSQDMGRAMAHAQAIAQATGALVLLVGHTGKDETKGLRGWSGMLAAFDVALQLERDGDLRQVTVVKQKDGPGEGDEYPFHLNNVVLGQDEDGDDITSCVALEGNAEGAGRRRPAKKLGVNQTLMLKAFDDLVALSGPPKEHELIDAARHLLPAPEGKKDTRRDSMIKALNGLVHAKVLKVASGNTIEAV